MSARYPFLVLASLVISAAQEPDTKPPAQPPRAARSSTASNESAWLGFSVRTPDPGRVARITALPPGMGIEIHSIVLGGPADAAKLNPMDVLWKFGDQMLVNQAQLATLISLKKPGEKITLSIFRDDKPLEITIKLGETQDNPNVFSKDMVDAAILPDEGSPMKIINMLDRSATFSNRDGNALIRREGDGYKVVINGADKQILFDGTLPSDGSLVGIPADWHRRICVLRRSLDHALDSRSVPIRSPRPRVVPAPALPANAAQPPAVPASKP